MVPQVLATTLCSISYRLLIQIVSSPSTVGDVCRHVPLHNGHCLRLLKRRCTYEPWKVVPSHFKQVLLPHLKEIKAISLCPANRELAELLLCETLWSKSSKYRASWMVTIKMVIVVLIEASIVNKVLLIVLRCISSTWVVKIMLKVISLPHTSMIIGMNLGI